MPTYNFVCEECKLLWELECSFDEYDLKFDEAKMCKQCNKEGHRAYEDTAIVFKGYGWTQTDARMKKFARDGYEKVEGDRFLEGAIKRSKRDQEQGYKAYKDYKIQPEYFVKKGLARKLSTAEAEKKKDLLIKTNEQFVQEHKTVSKHPQGG